MKYRRMPIEAESPEQFGYDKIKFNLAESSVSDRFLGEFNVALQKELLCYGDHVGHPGLRRLVAEAAGGALCADDVLITAGAASALFIIATSILEQNDHMIVVRPNYATNIETPRALGCNIDYIDLDFETGFRIDLNLLAQLIRPETKLVSITTPHNPTGVRVSDDEIKDILRILEGGPARLLVDETYKDMGPDAMRDSAAVLSPKIIAVSSLSKSYGIPGIRIGWLICSDKALAETFLCAKEQIGICGSVVDEEIAFRAYSKRRQWIPLNNDRIAKSLGAVREWVAQSPDIEWVEPEGGCVCFLRIAPDAPVSVEQFYHILNERYGTYVGPGHWFEMPKRYFRIGHAWPTLEELRAGLNNISLALAEARK